MQQQPGANVAEVEKQMRAQGDSIYAGSAVVGLCAVFLAVFATWAYRRFSGAEARRLDREDNLQMAQDCEDQAARFVGLAQEAEKAGNLMVANDYRHRAEDQKRRAGRLRRRR
jgi:hypothetical protein